MEEQERLTADEERRGEADRVPSRTVRPMRLGRGERRSMEADVLQKKTTSVIIITANNLRIEGKMFVGPQIRLSTSSTCLRKDL